MSSLFCYSRGSFICLVLALLLRTFHSIVAVASNLAKLAMRISSTSIQVEQKHERERLY
ncbi:uncharacterized protein BDZ99DRAFT_468981 [Mytilinidion resinicola]|uniref:Uncharacterized protein n=1 Tax=Mytilinidion resinicola TaxID=574789 RepID=A0A6A6Y1L0_9PEZI|nr:uncharacterized protein BDZ99DRAFT_468981 [Mytilinidion resinicola]KAF2802540.1 hypothetical protein BDZ99DRAFT_468981 [Mytilinidion resinicola]